MANLVDRIARYFGYEKMALGLKQVPFMGRGYQYRYIDFKINPGENVLDIGSGPNPFKFGTIQLDLYHEDNAHRGGAPLARDGRPNIVADIEHMPFADGEFDFAYCSHVLEHVQNPATACREIMRVAKRGYIETPTRLSDIMYDLTHMHRWHVSLVEKTLLFVPYSDREKRGTGVKFFERQMHSPYKNVFSNMVYENRDLFCNMMLWEHRFDFFVFDQEGNLVESSK